MYKREPVKNCSRAGKERYSETQENTQKIYYYSYLNSEYEYKTRFPWITGDEREDKDVWYSQLEAFFEA